jgi:hypothetical protein
MMFMSVSKGHAQMCERFFGMTMLLSKPIPNIPLGAK